MQKMGRKSKTEARPERVFLQKGILETLLYHPEAGRSTQHFYDFLVSIDFYNN